MTDDLWRIDCSSVGSVRTCWRITWRTRGPLKVCWRFFDPGFEVLTLGREVLVGKKNLEVRPIAINKVKSMFRLFSVCSELTARQGEIVKRILYQNPDAEFIFCAGDDKVGTYYFLRASA